MRARVGEYLTRMVSDGYSAKTVKNDMAVLEGLFNLAADRAVISSVPRLPKVRPPKPRAEVLTAGEASQVINAFKVQAFLGHADLSTTRRYVRDTADGLREAARVLELASPQQVTAT
jgi:integrase